MHEQWPTTQTMKISEVRGHFNMLVNQVFRKEIRVVVEKSGIPVAGLVSAEDVKRLDQLDREREVDFTIIDEVREAFRDVPDEEIERETNRILGINQDEAASSASATVSDRQRAMTVTFLDANVLGHRAILMPIIGL